MHGHRPPACIELDLCCNNLHGAGQAHQLRLLPTVAHPGPLPNQEKLTRQPHTWQSRHRLSKQTSCTFGKDNRTDNCPAVVRSNKKTVSKDKRTQRHAAVVHPNSSTIENICLTKVDQHTRGVPDVTHLSKIIVHLTQILHAQPPAVIYLQKGTANLAQTAAQAVVQASPF